jgi:hypothetical protein
VVGVRMRLGVVATGNDRDDPWAPAPAAGNDDTVVAVGAEH